MTATTADLAPQNGVSAEAREVAAYVRSLVASVDRKHGPIVAAYARRAARELEDLVDVLADIDQEVRP